MASELMTVEDIATSLAVTTDQVLNVVILERIMPAAFIQRKCYDTTDVSRICEAIERTTDRAPIGGADTRPTSCSRRH